MILDASVHCVVQKKFLCAKRLVEKKMNSSKKPEPYLAAEESRQVYLDNGEQLEYLTDQVKAENMNETKQQAISILRGVWGHQNNMSKVQVEWLTERERTGEKLLDTCARLAEVDIRKIPPFDHMAILIACARAEVTPAKEKQA